MGGLRQRLRHRCSGYSPLNSPRCRSIGTRPVRLTIQIGQPHSFAEPSVSTLAQGCRHRGNRPSRPSCGIRKSSNDVKSIRIVRASTLTSARPASVQARARPSRFTSGENSPWHGAQLHWDRARMLYRRSCAKLGSRPARPRCAAATVPPSRVTRRISRTARAPSRDELDNWRRDCVIERTVENGIAHASPTSNSTRGSLLRALACSTSGS